jgi:pyruvate carboxylase
MIDDAVRLTAAANYKNAGTVEFLVDQQGRYYFIEVNPRIQVEHTITEEITGIDLVQSQIRIANGESFEDLGLIQDKIKILAHAMQCRVTTENPTLNFQPDSGVIEVFRAPAGMGIRLDDGPGFGGAHITPHYDSLLVKVTARALQRQDAARKLKRALKEFRVRGVTTNKNFLLNVLNHPDFIDGTVDTSFIADNPQLVVPTISTNRGQKLLRYIGNTIVNGPEKDLGATGPRPSGMDPIVPVCMMNIMEKHTRIQCFMLRVCVCVVVGIRNVTSKRGAPYTDNVILALTGHLRTRRTCRICQGCASS